MLVFSAVFHGLIFWLNILQYLSIYIDIDIDNYKIKFKKLRAQKYNILNMKLILKESVRIPISYLFDPESFYLQLNHSLLLYPNISAISFPRTFDIPNRCSIQMQPSGTRITKQNRSALSVQD